LERLDDGFTDLDELVLLVPERPCETVLSLLEGEVSLDVQETQSIA
jgi:hypothetical protein